MLLSVVIGPRGPKTSIANLGTPALRSPAIANFVFTIELIGVFFFAASGALVARSKSMDAVGSFTLAFVTAFGGGTVRDLVLDIHPVSWIAHPEMLALVAVTAVVLTYAAPPAFLTGPVAVVSDSIGLALFSVAGTQIALRAEVPWLPASLLGVCSGVVGGVIRDTLANEIPAIFQKTQHLYATCSLVGCWVFIGLNAIDGVPRVVAASVALVIIAAMRLSATKWKITLGRP